MLYINERKARTIMKAISMIAGVIGGVAICNACPIIPIIGGLCLIGAGAVAVKQ